MKTTFQVFASYISAISGAEGVRWNDGLAVRSYINLQFAAAICYAPAVNVGVRQCASLIIRIVFPQQKGLCTVY